MDWKSITIDDKELINGFIKNKFETCDYNFTNQFLWSQEEKTQYRITEDGDVISLRSTFMDMINYYMPISKTENVENIKNEIKKILIPGSKVCLIPEKWYNLLGEEDFIWEEPRYTFDYVYNYTDLATLAGRKYSKKKNRINHFLANYPDYKYEPITAKNVSRVIKFQEDWCHDKECDIVPILKSENMGIHQLLNNFGKLDYKGAFLEVNGEIVCYTLGEPITDEYVVIHIEKGINDYIGSYQMINKLFLANEFQGYKYVNREDDFGNEGLREAKLSYHPIFLLKKYEIVGLK
ncbi:MAG: phosphatidylglycerol lysyltransferase domain-containing protein [Fusobacteriaceae bacterium]|jgi:hypothetical protein|nr:phosphatidylglycerol lysyltransferase domain-containing protein [Fusobacteriaceae bacterium]